MRYFSTLLFLQRAIFAATNQNPAREGRCSSPARNHQRNSVEVDVCTIPIQQEDIRTTDSTDALWNLQAVTKSAKGKQYTKIAISIDRAVNLSARGFPAVRPYRNSDSDEGKTAFLTPQSANYP